MTKEIIHGLPWPAILLDETGVVVHANNLALELAGLRELPEGAPFEELFPELDHALQGAPRSVVTQKAPLTLRRDSADLHFQLHVRRLSKGSLMVLFDETEMRNLELRSAQNVRLASLGFMLAGVCHEVANPLAATYSMVQTLQTRMNTSGSLDPIVTRGLDNIASNVRRILQVSSRVSAFSRVCDEPQTFAVDHAIDEALALLATESELGQLGEGLQGVSIRRRQNPTAVVFGRLHELRQVFFNILLNSMQALGGRGDVMVDVNYAPADDVVVITVQDSGPGIPKEHLHRVFEPFFSTKAGNHGSGLGLAISYELVLEHGGELSVTNQPAGGACFRLVFPVASEDL